MHSLVGEGARARHDANLALAVDVAGHDANLAPAQAPRRVSQKEQAQAQSTSTKQRGSVDILAGLDDAGAVGANEACGSLLAEGMLHLRMRGEGVP